MRFTQPFNETFYIGTLKPFGGNNEMQPSTKGLWIFKIWEAEKEKVGDEGIENESRIGKEIIKENVDINFLPRRRGW